MFQLTTSITMAGCVLTLFAAAEPAVSDWESFLGYLIYLGPVVLLIAAVFVLTFWTQRRAVARQAKYMAKMTAHLDAMESKTDRMIMLLESIERCLHEPPSE